MAAETEGTMTQTTVLTTSSMTTTSPVRKKKAQKKKEGSGFSKALGTIGSIAGTVGSIASLFCDERVKTDIAPLQVSEVDDALSQMAFAVKAIREHA